MSNSTASLCAKDIANMSFTPNYKTYTLKELLIAKHNVCRDTYPERSEKIELAIYNKENGIVEEEDTVTVEINKYSTFWPRCWAAIIDGVLFAIILYVECLVFGVEYSLNDIFLQAINGLQFTIYSIFMLGYFGQTLGKMFMGVKVLNHDTETDINVKQAVRRESVNLVLNLSWIFFILVAATSIEISGVISKNIAYVAITLGFLAMAWGVSEFVTMLFNKKRRAVHDYIGRTVVVRT